MGGRKKLDDDREKHISPVKVAITAALVGAIVGSILTFSLPRLYEYWLRPPEVVNISPEEIIEWYKSIQKLDPLHAEAFFNTVYRGQYVRWTGVVQDIQVTHRWPLVGAVITWPYVTAKFIGFSLRDLAAVKVGKKVEVTCRIGDPLFLFMSKVTLDHCRLEKVDTIN